MMRPPIGFCSFIMRKACCVHRKVPCTIEPMTPFQRSHARSSISDAAPKPALLNRTSSRPKVAFVFANKASTDAGSLTSVGTPSALTCSASISLTTACSGSGRRPATTIAKPSRASASADALPIPLPPPVISATLPFDAMLSLLHLPSHLGWPTISGFKSGGSELLGATHYSATADAPDSYEKTRRRRSGGGGIRVSGLPGQGDCHTGPLAGCAIDRDRAAMQFDDRLAER